jgi:hypothetical protein
MSSIKSLKQAYSEADIQNTISAFKDRKFQSIRKAAIAFNVPNATFEVASLDELHV